MCHRLLGSCCLIPYELLLPARRPRRDVCDADRSRLASRTGEGIATIISSDCMTVGTLIHRLAEYSTRLSTLPDPPPSDIQSQQLPVFSHR